MVKIGEALRAAKARLENISPSPGLDASLLLAAALEVDRAYVLAFGEKPLPEDAERRFNDWMMRAAAGEPIPYILGTRAFYDLDLKVNPTVLIPRPETELLLEAALEFARPRPSLTAVDVGTGSGALAVAFAVHQPQATVYALDVSREALLVARENAARYGVDGRIIFIEGDLLSPLIERGVQADLIMANLPYIPSAEVPELAVSRYEPHLALDGGYDGLDLYRRLFTQLPSAAKPGALALLEIAAYQGAAAWAAAQSLPSLPSIQIMQDYAGLDRIVRLEL